MIFTERYFCERDQSYLALKWHNGKWVASQPRNLKFKAPFQDIKWDLAMVALMDMLLFMVWCTLISYPTPNNGNAD